MVSNCRRLLPPFSKRGVSLALCFLVCFVCCPAKASVFPQPQTGTGAVVVRFNQIAQVTGVPVKILYSIALTESGKKYQNGHFKPWPWTLNVQGQSLFFRTREAAWLALTTYLSLGITLIDVGLMQVNWYYHSRRLQDPWLALDPNFNAKIGAQILREQYRGDGDWFGAAGRYHAPAVWFNAARYQEKVLAHYKRL